MWYAAGNPASYGQIAKIGLGALGFSVITIPELEPVLATYKKDIAEAEPIGAFVNDNLMVVSAAFLNEDSDLAFQSAIDAKLNYLQSNVFRYHDTFPHPAHAPYWPELIPDYTEESLRAASQVGAVICGNPDEALEQCRRWESAGTDQLTFGMAQGLPKETIIETIRLLGEYVIPKMDTDPEHRTTRFRREAAERAAR